MISLILLIPCVVLLIIVVYIAREIRNELREHDRDRSDGDQQP